MRTCALRAVVVVVGTTVWPGAGVFAQANLPRNGSFELGLQNWGWYTRGGDGYHTDIGVTHLDPRPVRIALPGAPDGSHVLRFEAPEHCVFVGFTRAYETQPGDHSLRLWVRTDLPLRVQVVDAGTSRGTSVAQLSAAPAPDWQLLEATCAIPDGVSLVALSVSGKGPGRVELDGVSLARTGEAPGKPVDLGLESATGSQVLFAGEAVRITARATSASPFSGTVAYRVENAWGEAVGAGAEPMEASGGELAQTTLRLDLPFTGHYRILAQVRDGGQALSDTAELLVAVIPPRHLPTSTADAERNRFGCNMEHRPWLIQLARMIGMRWVMCGPPLFTKWFCAEPRKGEWLYYDPVVEEFEAAGLRLVGNLADPPYWATHPADERPSGPWPNPNLPLDMADWDEYVRRVCDHYRPRITHWALWNEPNHPGFLAVTEGGSWVGCYLQLLARTHAVLKAVDPTLQLVGGTVTNPGALPPLITPESVQQMDVGAFHWAAWSPDGYLRNTGEELGFLGPKETWVNCIQRITDALAAAGRTIPLWNTECHITEADVKREFVTQPDPEKSYDTPRMTALDAANAIPRQYITEWAAGIDKTFYWLLADYSSSWQGRNASTLVEWDRSPTAALVAYAVMTDKLADAELVDWESQTYTDVMERPTIWTFRFRTPAGRLLVVWSNCDVETEVTLPVRGSGVKVWDLFGVERRGVRSMSGVDLQDRIVLRVARSPFYVLEPGT